MNSRKFSNPFNDMDVGNMNETTFCYFHFVIYAASITYENVCCSLYCSVINNSFMTKR